MPPPFQSFFYHFRVKRIEFHISEEYKISGLYTIFFSKAAKGVKDT